MKNVTTIITICFFLLSLTQCSSHENNIEDQKKISEFNIDGEFRKFKQEVMPIVNSWVEQDKIVRKHLEKFGNNLLRSEISIGLKTEAKQNIDKCQKNLSEIKDSVASFENSKSSDVCELVKQFQLFCQHAQDNYDQFCVLFSKIDDREYLNEQAQIILKYDEDLREQYNRVKDLFETIDGNESSKKLIAAIKFQYSEQEIKLMELWKKKKAEKNPWMGMSRKEIREVLGAGMFSMGNRHLFEKGEEDEANKCYSTGSVMGFAPSIEMIRAAYGEKMDNPSLILVYTNLVISYGHNELYKDYHEIRKQWIDKGAANLIKEIERIAGQKKLKIEQFINRFDNGQVANLFDENSYEKCGFLEEDRRLGWDYWEKYL